MAHHKQDIRLIMKCCGMHFYEGISQADIARRLGLSHPTVCRLIKQAKEEGIVRIQIVNPYGAEDFTDLERKLEQQLGLKEVVVTPDGLGDDESEKREVGKAAARYLARILEKNDVVGLSMGTTLHAIPRMVSQPLNLHNVFVPILGGVGQNNAEVHPNNLCNAFATAFGGESRFLHAPAHISSPIIKETLLQEKSVLEVMDYYNRLKVAVVGIGSPDKGTVLVETNYYPENLIRDLYNDGMVGDICLQFFDINGNADRYPVNRNSFGMELHRLRDIPWSVGVATGVNKTKAVTGAIRAGYINVLIVNCALAQSILNFAEHSPAPEPGPNSTERGERK